jgi:hypothetical protein
MAADADTLAALELVCAPPVELEQDRAPLSFPPEEQPHPPPGLDVGAVALVAGVDVGAAVLSAGAIGEDGGGAVMDTGRRTSTVSSASISPTLPSQGMGWTSSWCV